MAVLASSLLIRREEIFFQAHRTLAAVLGFPFRIVYFGGVGLFASPGQEFCPATESSLDRTRTCFRCLYVSLLLFLILLKRLQRRRLSGARAFRLRIRRSVWLGSENTTPSACREPRINISGAPHERAGNSLEEARSLSSVPQQSLYTVCIFLVLEGINGYKGTAGGHRFHYCSAMLCKAVRGRLCLCSETPAFTRILLLSVFWG